MTSFAWTRTFNGAPAISPPVKGPGAQIYAGGGQSGSNSASATEQVTFTGTWTPDPNLASDPAPPSVIVKIITSAESYSVVNGTQAPGTDASDGEPDSINSYSIAGGTHYRVETGSSFMETLTLEASNTNPSGFAFAGVGGVSVSIVNRGWAGPYYFHYIRYRTMQGGAETDGANNTAAPNPTIEDIPDGTSSFLPPTTASNDSEVGGYITPVWYWVGPDLGVLPPPFEINVNTSADCADSNNTSNVGSVTDGIGNTQVYTPFGLEDADSETTAVTVRSDQYAPGQGNGYWAIGRTYHLYSQISASAFEQSPYNLQTDIDLSTAIDSGLNN